MKNVKHFWEIFMYPWMAIIKVRPHLSMHLSIISRGASSTWENFSQMGEFLPNWENKNLGPNRRFSPKINGRTLFHKALVPA